MFGARVQLRARIQFRIECDIIVQFDIADGVGTPDLKASMLEYIGDPNNRQMTVNPGISNRQTTHTGLLVHDWFGDWR